MFIITYGNAYLSDGLLYTNKIENALTFDSLNEANSVCAYVERTTGDTVMSMEL